MAVDCDNTVSAFGPNRSPALGLRSFFALCSASFIRFLLVLDIKLTLL